MCSRENAPQQADSCHFSGLSALLTVFGRSELARERGSDSDLAKFVSAVAPGGTCFERAPPRQRRRVDIDAAARAREEGPVNVRLSRARSRFTNRPHKAMRSATLRDVAAACVCGSAQRKRPAATTHARARAGRQITCASVRRRRLSPVRQRRQGDKDVLQLPQRQLASRAREASRAAVLQRPQRLSGIAS